MNLLILGVQALFALDAAEGPVRFGVPLPAEALAEGLGLSGRGTLQWRRLPVGGPDADPVWVEVALDDLRGRVRVVRGGDGACAAERGPVLVHEREERVVPHGRELVDRWAWRSGVVDERVRIAFHARTTLAGETFDVGETLTRWSAAARGRSAGSCALPRRLWERSGVIPPGGRLGRAVRDHLLRARAGLVEMPGLRGAGDFVRGEATVTNLEYDTALGLLRLALTTGDAECLAQAVRVATHQRDRDLDLRTGLPFVHGLDHRGGQVEGGHAWVQGMLLVGLVTADDSLVEAAHAIARGIATRPPHGQGRFERARDHAWPLLELEAYLAVDPDPVLAAAADRLADSIDRRFDAASRTWRFGEGELGSGVHLERGWITGGILIPALRRHLARRSHPALARRVALAQEALLDRIGRARAGLPTHWRTAAGTVFAEHRAERDPKAMLLLEGLPAAELRRLLQREEVRDSTSEVPRLDDPDLPTAFAMVARCWWVYR